MAVWPIFMIIYLSNSSTLPQIWVFLMKSNDWFTLQSLSLLLGCSIDVILTWSSGSTSITEEAEALTIKPTSPDLANPASHA